MDKRTFLKENKILKEKAKEKTKRNEPKERFYDEELFRENEKGSRREAEFLPAAFMLFKYILRALKFRFTFSH